MKINTGISSSESYTTYERPKSPPTVPYEPYPPVTRRPWVCVICGGAGYIPEFSSTSTYSRVCHACSGTGVLWG